MADFTELKQKQKAMWALGEYDRIADSLHSAQDHTLRVARPRPNERVLDVATGTGNTAIKARAFGAKVTGVDLTPELIAVARKKAEAEGFPDIEFREGDAERLPFQDATFDLVVSTCGHMFAPDQERVAAELVRVTRPGCRIVFQAWSPEGGLGGYFRIMNKHVPPPAGVPSPFNWGDPEKARALLGTGVTDLRFEAGDCPQLGKSPEDAWDIYRTKYGPTTRAWGLLDEPKRADLSREMTEYLRGYQARDGKVRWGREYIVASCRRR